MLWYKFHKETKSIQNGDLTLGHGHPEYIWISKLGQPFRSQFVLYLGLWTGLAGATRLTRSDFKLHIGWIYFYLRGRGAWGLTLLHPGCSSLTAPSWVLQADCSILVQFFSSLLIFISVDSNKQLWCSFCSPVLPCLNKSLNLPLRNTLD